MRLEYSLAPSRGRENQAHEEAGSPTTSENVTDKQADCKKRFILCFVVTVIVGILLFIIDVLGVHLSRQQTWILGLIVVSCLGLLMVFISGFSRLRSRMRNDLEQIETSRYNGSTIRPMISRSLSAILEEDEEEEEPTAPNSNVTYGQLEQNVSRRIDLYSHFAFNNSQDTTSTLNQDPQFEGASSERDCQIQRHIMVTITGSPILQFCLDEKNTAELEDAYLPSYDEVRRNETPWIPPPPYIEVDDEDASD